MTEHPLPSVSTCPLLADGFAGFTQSVCSDLWQTVNKGTLFSFPSFDLRNVKYAMTSLESVQIKKKSQWETLILTSKTEMQGFFLCCAVLDS